MKFESITLYMLLKSFIINQLLVTYMKSKVTAVVLIVKKGAPHTWTTLELLP